jgi:hypothetical protein
MLLCTTMPSPSSCYYMVVVTPACSYNVATRIMLLFEKRQLLHCCCYTRCDDRITSHKQKKQNITLKCGLGVWMGKGGNWRQRGRCKKPGHLVGREKEGSRGPKKIGSPGLMNLDLSLSVLIHGWCTGGCWVAQADT